MLHTIAATIIIAVLSLIARVTMKGFKTHEESHDLLKDANLYQIKATILFMYRHTRENNNQISSKELDVFNDLYTVYKKLGGNGFIENIKNKVNCCEITMDE